MRNGTERRPALAACIAALGFALTIGLVAPHPAAASQSKGGTVSDRAEYEYKVTHFDYDAGVAMTAAEEPAPACVPGVTSAWSGDVGTSTALVSPLVLGDGSLEIGRRGSHGSAQANSDFDFEFGQDFDGQRAGHEVVTACQGGQPDGATQTFCTDTLTAGVDAFAGFEGGVGNLVRVRWNFTQADVAGSWVPNTFICEETFIYHARGQCRPKKLPLSTFTAKRFKLPFSCILSSLGPPPGTGYDVYVAGGLVSGFLKLKRTRQG